MTIDVLDIVCLIGLWMVILYSCKLVRLVIEYWYVSPRNEQPYLRKGEFHDAVNPQ